MKPIKGIYVLIIKVNKPINVNVGRLGKLKFDKGLYAYVGSAQNNLVSRIARHKRKNKKKFWHVDYLLSNKSAKIIKVLYAKRKKEWECKIAKQLSKQAEPIIGFGCSDCKCHSHLFKINKDVIKNLRLLNLKEFNA